MEHVELMGAWVGRLGLIITPLFFNFTFFFLSYDHSSLVHAGNNYNLINKS
jgi:hypothetical protein